MKFLFDFWLNLYLFGRLIFSKNSFQIFHFNANCNAKMPQLLSFPLRNVVYPSEYVILIILISQILDDNTKDCVYLPQFHHYQIECRKWMADLLWIDWGLAQTSWRLLSFGSMSHRRSETRARSTFWILIIV